MRARTAPLIVSAAALAACGCASRDFRCPTPFLPPVGVEGPSQERFDPFADDDLGPETNTRPPDYLNGRPATRRQFPTGPVRPPAGQGPLSPFPGLGGLYPDAVR